MNGKDYKWLDEKFKHVDKRITEVHIDVVKIKTEWKLAKATILATAAAISLIIGIITTIFRR